MANQLISLLDITKRSGSDSAIGLLEETTTYAPELQTLMGRPISGTVYKATSRTLPTVAFRKANDGSDTIKSGYSQKLAECFIIDGQIQQDKAVVDAEAKSGINQSVGDIMFDEAQGVLMAAGITIGAQVWYGTSSDANGFAGILSLTNTLNTGTGPTNPAPVVSAGGTTSSVQTSAYLVWNHVKGVHFVWGNNQGFDMSNEYRVQTVLGNNSKNMTAYVNNLQGWIGLAVNHSKSVARIANCEDASNKRLTDAVAAKLLSYVPLAIQQSGGLRWFMNQQAAYQLQVSRSAGTGITSDEPLKFAPTPTSLAGIPITITNSITNTEAVVS
jgi:hypothetical protein